MRRHQKQKAAQKAENAKTKTEDEEDYDYKAQEPPISHAEVSHPAPGIEQGCSTQHNRDPEGAMDEEEAMMISGARWDTEKQSASGAGVVEPGQEPSGSGKKVASGKSWCNLL